MDKEDVDVIKIGVSISHYKAFGASRQGFDRIMPVNLIIGRNNSGKSSLIDLIEWCTKPHKFNDTVELIGGQRRGITPEIWITEGHDDLMDGQVPGTPIADYMASRWPEHPIDDWKSKIDPSRWSDFKEFWKPLRVQWQWGKPNSVRIVSEVPHATSEGRTISMTAQNFLDAQMGTGLRTMRAVPLSGKTFHRMAAERSVTREPLNTDSLDIAKDGSGATNLIHRFIMDNVLQRHIVEERLLASLNQVFEPDARFTAIQIQRVDGSKEDEYEIYLEEESKGPVSISDSGSGLQTVLLVLASIDVLPHIPGKMESLTGWVFAFEELENNLHPALQRRLFWLLCERAVQFGATFFLTTHSPIVVDLFSDDEYSQVIHVTHDGESATATNVFDYASRRSILVDLDVRASDLLQANSIVWVEGPTDRMYVNRWIDLWTNGELREGKDYQCMFYGGRLLNHLSASEPAEYQAEAIEILRINANAVVLIDSDKNNKYGSINKTKRRLKDEIEAGSGLAWITKGREIEHYIPHATFASLFGPKTKVLGQFDDVLPYLNKAEGKNRKGYDKIKLAESVIPHITRTDLEEHLDLSSRLEEICDAIREWNKRPAPAPRTVI